MISAITKPTHFFAEIVTEDVNALNGSNPTLRSAYHACTSLLSYRDWIHCVYAGKRWQHKECYFPEISGKGSFQAALESIDPNFAIVTDISNASKHMALEAARSRSGIGANADTSVHRMTGALGGAPIGAMPIGGGSISNIYVTANGQSHNVRHAVHSVFTTWEQLNAQNGW